MPIPHLHAADGTDATSVKNSDGTLGARFDSYGRERQGTQPGPTVAVGAGAAGGTGSSVVAHTGTDNIGNIQIHSGTVPVAGALATVTFAVPFTGTNPPIVQLEAKDAGGAAIFYYATCTNTVLTVNTQLAAAASTNYAFDYVVICGA